MDESAHGKYKQQYTKYSKIIQDNNTMNNVKIKSTLKKDIQPVHQRGIPIPGHREKSAWKEIYGLQN